jgi:hypothetical protein
MRLPARLLATPLLAQDQTRQHRVSHQALYMTRDYGRPNGCPAWDVQVMSSF